MYKNNLQKKMICEQCKKKFENLYEVENNGKTLIVCHSCHRLLKGYVRKTFGKIIYEKT